jgi:L-alanine-DL-glutamate epimerase-like enolase superfamily enzyme
MKITSVQTIPLEIPLPKTFSGSRYKKTKRSTIITKIYTDEGVVSEIYNGDNSEGYKEVIRYIHEVLEPLIVGENCWIL